MLMLDAVTHERTHQDAGALMFGDLLDAAPDALVITDEAGLIRMANTRSAQLFGYTREELIGTPIEALVPARYRDRHPAHRADYAAASRARPMGEGSDLCALRKDGSEFAAEISLSPLATPHGRCTIAAIRDISERRRLEAERRRGLEEANRLKTQLLANMSHELRSPLNAIIGFAKLMYHGRVGALAETHREYLGDILTSAEHLLHLINDVLDLSKVEAGCMEFAPEPVDLAQLTQEVHGSLRALALAKQITLESEVDSDCTSVELDSGRLKQVLYNYLSNALKFTQDGGCVRLTARLVDSETLRIEVSDSGIGIHSADLDSLFVPFRQLDSSASKLHQGTGLGLALTKRIVEQQGGHVGVISEYGRGSTFYAVLPRRHAAQPRPRSQQPRQP
jgi:protein-histidine pros-kinase